MRRRGGIIKTLHGIVFPWMVTGASRSIRIGSAVSNRKCKVVMFDITWDSYFSLT